MEEINVTQEVTTAERITPNYVSIASDLVLNITDALEQPGVGIFVDDALICLGIASGLFYSAAPDDLKAEMQERFERAFDFGASMKDEAEID